MADNPRLELLPTSSSKLPDWCRLLVSDGGSPNGTMELGGDLFAGHEGRGGRLSSSQHDPSNLGQSWADW